MHHDARRAGVGSDEVHFLVDYETIQRRDAGGGAASFMPVEPGRVSVIIASHDRCNGLESMLSACACACVRLRLRVRMCRRWEFALN